MNFSFWISRRLRLNGVKQGANATGVVIAVTGVALALIIMEFTIAIVLGFKHQITQKIMGFDGEVWVMPDYHYTDGTSSLLLQRNNALDSIIDATLPGASTTLSFNQPGIIKTEGDFAGVYFVGFDNSYDYAFEKSNILDGELPDYTDPDNASKIVLSRPTASALQLKVGDKVNGCFFVDEAIKSRKFEIAGIYESGFGDYDRTIVYAPISTLRKVAASDSLTGTKLNIRLPDTEDIERDAEDLQVALIDAYQEGKTDLLYPVDNVKHTGAIYFNWLELLNTNVVVIFILMIAVAAFTLISSMFILILERISTIGILRSLGTTKSQIRNIFIYMTLRIVGIGLIIGNVIGIGLLLIQQHYQIMTLNPEMYYLRYVPVEINPLYFVYLNIGVILISWLILVIPSRMAARISPAVTMRFE